MNPPTGTDGGLWCPTVRRIFKRLCMGHELHDGPVGGEMDTEKKCFVGTEACPVTVRGADPRGYFEGGECHTTGNPGANILDIYVSVHALAGPGVRLGEEIST